MNIVGYRSPFKKKSSPMKFDPVTLIAQTALSALPGLIQAGTSLIGSGSRAKEKRKARKQFNEAFREFENIQFENPYANLTNPLAGMQNPYAENIYEDLTVDTGAADYLKQQQQQSQANLMQQFRGAAGGSGVGALAQSLSNIANEEARKASLQLAQQRQANEKLRLAGEEQRRKAAYDIDLMQRRATGEINILKASGEDKKRLLEARKKEALLGLAADRKLAADQAVATARGQFFGGIGDAIGGVTGVYAPGGMRAGKFQDDLFNLSSGRFGYSMPEGGMSPAGYFEDGVFKLFPESDGFDPNQIITYPYNP